MSEFCARCGEKVRPELEVVYSPDGEAWKEKADQLSKLVSLLVGKLGGEVELTDLELASAGIYVLKGGPEHIVELRSFLKKDQEDG